MLVSVKWQKSTCVAVHLFRSSVGTRWNRARMQQRNVGEWEVEPLTSMYTLIHTTFGGVGTCSSSSMLYGNYVQWCTTSSLMEMAY